MSATSFLLLLTPLALVIAAFIVWPLMARRAVGGAGAGVNGAGMGVDGAGMGVDGSGAGIDGARGTSGMSDPGPDAQAAANRAVIAERRAQLDEEIRDLPPDSPERRQRIAEFTRAALADLEPDAALRRPGPAKRPMRLALLIGLLVVLLALPLIGYRIVGTPDWPGVLASRQHEEQDIRAMLAQVERRLAEHPEDAQGWLILGRTRLALGETAAGVEALERALAVDSADPVLAAQIRADLADALARSSGIDLAGRPTTLANEALARNPTSPKALALAGAFAAARGDAGLARRHWRRLLDGLPAGSEQASQVEGLLAQLPDAADAAAAGGAGTAASGAAGPRTAAAQAAAQAAGPHPAGPRLTGRIELDPGLAGQARVDDTVFIVARGLDAADEPTGPPVAVLRVRVADLPYDFVLDEGAAMTPAATLAHQPRVRIVARISRSGSARPGPGDIEGSSAPVANDASGVIVRLDRPVP